MKFLVVDDEEISRRLLTRMLGAWGHEVMAVEDGEEALDVLKNEDIQFVLSDWMMPRLSGPDMCRKIRTLELDRYVYVILITGKGEDDALVEGLEAGADDFMTKPVRRAELRVRIRAGERVLELESRLKHRNQELESTNAQLTEAYSVIRRDMDAAAAIQRSLLPSVAARIGAMRFSWLFLPCSYIAGDIFNFFSIDSQHIGVYVLDVAGHGLPAAMISVSISRILSVRLSMEVHGEPSRLLSPGQLLADLNERFQQADDAMQYFTMVYGVIDLPTRQLRLSCAGHPAPIIQFQDGTVYRPRVSGIPLGIFPNQDYPEEIIPLAKGARLFFYSDGVSEAESPDGQQYTSDRLLEFVERHRQHPLDQLLDGLKRDLHDWHGEEDFSDDVSLLAMECTMGTPQD